MLSALYRAWSTKGNLDYILFNRSQLSFCLLAKPVHNLAPRVFQRYYAELCEALSSCPEEVATVLYSNELVTKEERSRAVDVLGLTPFRKAEILVQAVEKRIVADSSSAPLKKFCQVLRRRHGVRSIVVRIKLRLGDWMMWVLFH